MITADQLSNIFSNLSYKPNWRFIQGYIGGAGSWYMQVEFTVPGEYGFTPDTVWRGRKWLLSQHMTEGEVVQTALMACLAAEEHEAREAFRYKGKALFGPHLSVGRLLEMADEVEVRP